MPDRSLDRIARRRRLLVAVVSFAASLAADAQTTDKVYRIGYLSIGSASSSYTRPLEAFRQRLHELGWDEGRSLLIEYRYAEGQADRLSALANELVGLKVDLIVASPTPSAQAASGGPSHRLRMESVKSAARSLGLPLQVFEVNEPSDFDAAFAAMVRERTGALLLSGDAMFFVHRARLADLATKSRLPSMSTQRQWPDAGGLLSYAPSFPEQWGRAATYVDKILRGAKPAELPFEQPSKFELVINLKAANALGLKIPHAMLVRADDVIR
jgi:ABC-type uncharacterized transport system substrate-binding protein